MVGGALMWGGWVGGRGCAYVGWVGRGWAGMSVCALMWGGWVGGGLACLCAGAGRCAVRACVQVRLVYVSVLCV